MATRGTTGEITSLGSSKKMDVRSNEQTVQYQNNHSGKIIALTSNALSYYLEKGKMKGSSVRLREVHNVNSLLSKHGGNHLCNSSFLSDTENINGIRSLCTAFRVRCSVF